VSSLSLTAHASEPGPSYTLTPPSPPVASSRTYPRVGGHLGFALPIFTLAKNSTIIGGDFVNIGLTPGITVTLDDHWSVDFEFVAYIPLKDLPQGVGIVVDPGVLYNFGDFTAGLRVATKVTEATNIGLIPIFVLPLKNLLSGPFTPFVEADVPIFFQDNRQPGGPGVASIGLQFQAGVAF